MNTNYEQFTKEPSQKSLPNSVMIKRVTLKAKTVNTFGFSKTKGMSSITSKRRLT